MIVTALVVITYTGLAGMMSVAYTDVVNGLVLIGGLLLAAPFFLADAGGFSGARAALPEGHLSLVGTLSPLEMLGLGLPAMVLLLGEANMYQRFYSARSEEAAARSVPLWFVLTVVIETLIVLLAVLGRVVYPDLAIEAGEHEQILLRVLRYALPTGVASLMLAAAVAIVVSTGTSFLLVPATNVVNDLYVRYVRPDASQGTRVRMTRAAIVVLGAWAFVQLAFFQSVLEMALYAYTMYGSLTPAILATFFWRRATAAGAVASIVGGMTTTFVWQFGSGRGWLSALPEWAVGLDPVIPALTLAVTLLILVSLATPPPAEARWRPFVKPSTGGIP
jgi:SSS family solute:Na+ symporter/sodium/proline symporter